MEDLYTLNEVSKKYKVSTRTVRREIDKHGIPIVRVGRQIRIPESSMKLLRKQDGNVNGAIIDEFNKIYRR